MTLDPMIFYKNLNKKSTIYLFVFTNLKSWPINLKKFLDIIIAISVLISTCTSSIHFLIQLGNFLFTFGLENLFIIKLLI